MDNLSSAKSYEDDPDVKLMLEFQAGDKASFEKLMVKYYPRILNFIYRFIPSREVSEDIAQEAFMRVYKSVQSYRPQSKFNTWLFTIAKNLSLNELRKNKKKGASLDAPIKSSEGSFIRQVEDKNALNPSDDLIQSEVSQVVKAAIEELPENQRMAVLLRRYENLSYDEIAKTMNTTAKAVKSLLSRAKENLKVRLASFKKSGDLQENPNQKG